MKRRRAKTTFDSLEGAWAEQVVKIRGRFCKLTPNGWVDVETGDVLHDGK